MWDERKSNEFEELEKAWEEECLRPALEAQPERREKFLTDIGLKIERIYTPLDLSLIHI